MRIRSITAPAALVSAALLLTACGGDSPLEGKTGAEVAELAADALEEAGSVHMTGTITEDGEETEVDIQLQGDDAAGTITVEGTEIELISIGGEDVYVKATQEFLDLLGLPTDAAAQIEGEWVAMPADAAADFADFSLAGFVDQLRDPDGEIEEETRKDEVDGESVVIVEQEDGSTLTVKDDDPAYPLEMTGGEDEGTIRFSEHGEDQEIEAPEDAIDLEELLGGA